MRWKALPEAHGTETTALYTGADETSLAVVRGSAACRSVFAPAAGATDVRSALTGAEVSAAVGTPLKRSPSDACRFGSGRASVCITMHAGGASQFDTYASQARRDSPDAKPVPGVGSNAIFFGFSLAVRYKRDLFVIQMMLGKSIPEKIALSKGRRVASDVPLVTAGPSSVREPVSRPRRYPALVSTFHSGGFRDPRVDKRSATMRSIFGQTHPTSGRTHPQTDRLRAGFPNARSSLQLEPELPS